MVEEAKKTDHDKLFKQLIETFFTEFMELFFPEASQAIDLRRFTFLQQELFTDIKVKEKHYVDIVVQTRLKGEPGLILVHVEPQASVQKTFNERMFVYFSRLYQTHRRKILPIAVFTYDKIRDEPDSFELGFKFLDVLKFHFYKLQLKKHNWRDYIRSNNPVAAALLCKMNFSKEERVKVKLEFLRMLARMRIDPARTELVASFFDTYFKPTIREERALAGELTKINPKEADIIMEFTTRWHEKGREEKAIEVAKRMLSREMDISTVSEITGLRPDKIERIKMQIIGNKQQLKMSKPR